MVPSLPLFPTLLRSWRRLRDGTGTYGPRRSLPPSGPLHRFRPFRSTKTTKTPSFPNKTPPFPNGTGRDGTGFDAFRSAMALRYAFRPLPARLHAVLCLLLSPPAGRLRDDGRDGRTNGGSAMLDECLTTQLLVPRPPSVPFPGPFTPLPSRFTASRPVFPEKGPNGKIPEWTGMRRMRLLP